MASTPPGSSTKEREFQCAFCNRKFRKLEHLQRHTRRHTHEKPFSCPCGACFSRQDLLRRHERIVHGSLSDSPHQSISVYNNSEQPQSPSVAQQRVRNAAAHASVGNHTNNLPPRDYGNLSLDEQPTRAEPAPLSRRFEALTEMLQMNDPVLDDTVAEPRSQFSTSTHVDNPDRSMTRNFAQGSSTHHAAQLVHELPTIFPAPQIALGAQIVPHFTHPTVAEYQRNSLLQSINGFGLPGWKLPSSDSLTRFLAGYFTGFYPYAPFTHAPTFRFEACSPELLLAMFAIGAANRFEYNSAINMFYVSKAILLERQHQRERGMLERLMNHGTSNDFVERDYMDEVRCLLCLMGIATWDKDLNLRNESLVLRGQLAHALRLSGLEEPSEVLDTHWETWARLESERRAKLFAFCFLNIQSIAYNLSPVIWSHEIKLRLPCSCPEWTAPDSATWALLRQNTPLTKSHFHTALKDLLSPSPCDINELNPTPVANYTLLHGLIQTIVWVQIFPKDLGADSTSDSRVCFRNALRKWTIYWQRTPESNLEPFDANGPLPFMSSAWLSFAYIRNCSQFSDGNSREIFSWNVASIARALRLSPSANHEWDELLAAHHATHFMGILVRLGIQYIKHNRASLWSIEAALCGLECSVFLDKWLRAFRTSSGPKSFTDQEHLLIAWTRDIVRDGSISINAVCPDLSSERPEDLVNGTIEVWCHIMQGDSPWPFISMLGDAVVEYKTICRHGLDKS
ncbi:hypothetical protein BDV30DRAFT_31714 [Aspergillus minisclerotigenes]|uniref:C2H2-type domain-containing protein n=1 Tax=Aspergillus minisclerotigenes TaxID=656917 RepID=A0A5N6JEW6_9EURO|nr:hypothetical protein BDV30DRAFT_31714 [Aspergillus minisclerotigenes]